jgi:hypothetical protein
MMQMFKEGIIDLQTKVIIIDEQEFRETKLNYCNSELINILGLKVESNDY